MRAVVVTSAGGSNGPRRNSDSTSSRSLRHVLHRNEAEDIRRIERTEPKC